jgi:hypothetical protein
VIDGTGTHSAFENHGILAVRRHWTQLPLGKSHEEAVAGYNPSQTLSQDLP